MTDTKLIFSLVDNADTVLEACSLNKQRVPVVALKVDQRQAIPDGAIDFENLIKPTGNISGFLLFSIY